MTEDMLDALTRYDDPLEITIRSFRVRRARRRYRMPAGRWDACEDCGRIRPRTIIVWWASGGTYRVCGECIRAYRHAILGPGHDHTIQANAR